MEVNAEVGANLVIALFVLFQLLVQVFCVGRRPMFPYSPLILKARGPSKLDYNSQWINISFSSVQGIHYDGPQPYLTFVKGQNH